MTEVSRKALRSNVLLEVSSAILETSEFVVLVRLAGQSPIPRGQFFVPSFEDELPVDREAEAPTTFSPDTHRGTTLVELALKEQQAALQVVPVARRLERRVEPHLPVRPLAAAVAFVVAQQPPEDAANDTLDQVLAVHERAPILREASDRGGDKFHR